MTELLEQAFIEANKLPDSEQNALARRILAELESERHWDRLFESTVGRVSDSITRRPTFPARSRHPCPAR